MVLESADVCAFPHVSREVKLITAYIKYSKARKMIYLNVQCLWFLFISIKVGMLVCVVGGILKRLIEFEGIFTLDQHAFYSCKDVMDLYNGYVRVGILATGFADGK